MFLLLCVCAFSFVLSSVEAQWPSGTYGLIKAATGCPDDEGVEWHNGSRTFDTEDTDAHNYFSFYSYYNIYLSGLFLPNDITIEFCMKLTHDNRTNEKVDWPQGSYCILKYQNCPTGFSEGSIYWDDDDYQNHNSYEGVMPDGTYNSNTEMFFCCRSDAEADTAMHLNATARPFVLLRYGYTCQQIEGMSVTDQFVRWDDEDLANSDSASGHHPFDDGGSKDHKLHFCHYTSDYFGRYPGSAIG